MPGHLSFSLPAALCAAEHAMAASSNPIYIGATFTNSPMLKLAVTASPDPVVPAYLVSSGMPSQRGADGHHYAVHAQQPAPFADLGFTDPHNVVEFDRPSCTAGGTQRRLSIVHYWYLPLCGGTDRPLIDTIRAGVTAGFAHLIIYGAGLRVAVARSGPRRRRPAAHGFH